MTELLSSIVWIWGITAGAFTFVNSIASPASKKAVYDFITAKSVDLHRLPQIALELFERIFGKRHFSLRCLFASVIASLIAISFWYILRVIIILYAFKNTPDFESQHTHFLWEELSYPFEDMTRSSFAVSVAVNIIIDYFALLKTRILVKLLAKTRPSIFLGIVFVIFDFLFSFVLFQCFYLLLDVASLIFIFGGKKFFLPAADPYSFYMTIEVLILSEFLLSPTSAPGTFYKFLTHSHVATLMILLTLAPISLVSVFFYASMMPSIWLWLFLLAASASRAIGTVYPWAIRALDFEQNAIRTLGYFLSILLSVVWLGFVGGVTLYFFILLRLAAY